MNEDKILVALAALTAAIQASPTADEYVSNTVAELSQQDIDNLLDELEDMFLVAENLCSRICELQANIRKY